MSVVRALIGLVLGFGIAFGSYYGTLTALRGGNTTPVVVDTAHSHGHASPKPSAGNTTAVAVGVACGVLGGVYSSIAFGRGIYTLGFFSILGFLLDLSWGLLNMAGSLVWLLACAVAGGDFVEPDERSRRSGTFVYSENPRGGGYAATTIGTVIAGGWSSHEEIHVWQARIFGPLYMPVYLSSLLLNMLFRVITGKFEALTMQAYYRICFEDWAYAGGTTSGGDINWGSWFLWSLLSLLYVSMPIVTVVGIMTKTIILSIISMGGLVTYSLIRAFLPAGE